MHTGSSLERELLLVDSLHRKLLNEPDIGVDNGHDGSHHCIIMFLVVLCELFEVLFSVVFSAHRCPVCDEQACAGTSNEPKYFIERAPARSKRI